MGLMSLAFGQQPFRQHTEVVVVVEALRVRETPALSAAQVGSQRRGDRGVVVDGSPYWADGYWWWKIAFRDGTIGWSADGERAFAYLEVATNVGRESGHEPSVYGEQSTSSDAVVVDALVESAFWSGTLTLSCVDGPPTPNLFEVDRFPLINGCVPSVLSSRDVDDLVLLESMAMDRTMRAGVRLVASVRTAGGTLVAVSYFNTFETGVRGVQQLLIYRLEGASLELAGRVYSELGFFWFLDAGGVARIVSPSGDRVFESHGGDFVLRQDLSYRVDELERLPHYAPEVSRVHERQQAVRRLAELQGIAFGGPPKARSFEEWVTAFFTGDLVVDCRDPPLRWDSGGRFDLGTTRCSEPVYSSELPAFREVHLGSVIIGGTVNLAVAKKGSVWLDDHLITFLTFHDQDECDNVYPCRFLVYQQAPDGYEGLLGVLSAESNITWFDVATTDQGATIRATEHVYVPGDGHGPSLGIEQTYAISATRIELRGREHVVYPGSYLDQFLIAELPASKLAPEEANRVVSDVIDVVLAPGLTTRQRRAHVEQLELRLREGLAGIHQDYQTEGDASAGQPSVQTDLGTQLQQGQAKVATAAPASALRDPIVLGIGMVLVGALVFQRMRLVGLAIMVVALLLMVGYAVSRTLQAQAVFRTDVSLHEMRSVHARAELPEVLATGRGVHTRPGHFQDQAVTTLSNLNLRSGPGTEYEVIEVLPIATQLPLTSESQIVGDWLRVRRDSGVGWVHIGFLGFGDGWMTGLLFRSLLVTAGGYVYAEPNVSSPVVASLDREDFVQFRRFANRSDLPTGPFVEVLTPMGVSGWFDARSVRLTSWPERLRTGGAGALSVLRDGTYEISVAEAVLTWLVVFVASVLVTSAGRYVLDEELAGLQFAIAIQVFFLQYHDRVTSLDLVGWFVVAPAIGAVASVTGAGSRRLVRRWLGQR